MTDTDDVLDALRTALDEHDAPVATAPQVAEHVPIGRRTVLNRLDVLDAADRVDSLTVGRSRVWWPTSPEPSTVPPAERPGENRHTGPSSRVPPAEPQGEPTEERPRADEPPAEPSTAPATEPSGEPPADLVDVVDALDWDEIMVSRTEARVRALAGALDQLREHGSLPTKRLRDQVLEAGVDGLAESTTGRMMQEVFRAVDVVEGDGPHAYQWTG